ncbi:MAG TPA: sigma-54-dependent Fis family transcriptional regulator [Porphyromonadaceae bacterium]|jgi:two-component system response regulator HydG|uniref:sigma-54-dependent transcriptional regulator n=1 Tax=Limibacterium fermenti TaxID=3229863 RepID=UPI000E901CE6|nr:sigma-54-dependent Fis family transcriptional regulator [Porphyromonadaceae bacterium]HBL33421.1 sigma-54-dependent Fis family transcriptional regulator [Porphyromonadaceae bacterium]HBX20823.1 sigma-54-dependent Fis family transcriptional regulator [Porphyromonadaceae bacterium]HBX47155.1 sigma-54-dependent Fis family transcriptional regulator [Porphyromonadaceae bacterium]HCM20123.1 sigma-54-dependent Fis family transcriptional regulator [Porphyromonadaceae bacterium]
MNGRILIIEDDVSFGTMLHKWFERNEFSVHLSSSMSAAQQYIVSDKIDIILSDLRLPDGDGILLLEWLKQQALDIPVIIMTGYGEVQTAVAAIKLGASDFLEKPVNPTVLKQKIESAFASSSSSQKKAPKQAKKLLKPSRATVRGKSPSLEQMYSHIDLVAPTQMAVMITGESGTGKEHVARLIHEKSARADGPFIAVDCGALSMELAPSELFGHKKGSFTSAIEDKTGFFWEANGGTLFLDEVGNLPYGVQMQLLRALQEKKIRPVGTANDLEVDVRILTATNENLEKAIAGGTFREDLYHRLNEFMIKVPPLRESVADIRLYAEFFLSEANIELDRNVTRISPDALKKLERYPWPGNLRELRNVIRRSVLFAKDEAITPESLPLLPERSGNDADTAPQPLHAAPEDEKQRILTALEKSNGNKSLAARLLQIDRKTLYNKIHLYNIEM